MHEYPPDESIQFTFKTIKEHDNFFKAILIGDSSVGKTSMIKRIKGLEFKEDYIPTLGLDYSTLNATIKDKRLKIQLWDIEAKKDSPQLLKDCFEDASLAMVVYDISNRESFESIKNWLILLEDVPKIQKIILVGNKTDLEEKREVQAKEAIDKYGSNEKIKKILECSAKENKGVEEIFKWVIKLLYTEKGNDKIIKK